MTQRFKRSLWSRSFRFKLMVTSIVCILVPSFITFSLYNMLTRDAMKQEAMLQSEQKLQLLDGYVSSLLDYMLYIANSIQNDSELNVIFKAIAAGQTYEGDNASYNEFLDRMKVITKIDNMTVNGERTFVSIVLEDGTSYANYSVNEYNPALLQEESWFSRLDQLRGLESLWIGTTPTVFLSEKKLNPYQISMARTLRGGGVNPYGYVIVTILESQISDILGRLSNEQETMLVDNQGVILAHIEEEKVGETVSFNGFLANDQRSSIIDLDGESYIISSLNLPLTGWKLVSLTSYKKAVFQLNFIFNQVFTLQLVSFVVFLLLFLYLIGNFTRPLVRLGKMAETVQRGNLEVRSHIAGNDEIGYLGSSFDLMLDRVKEMIAEVTTTQARKRKAELATLQAQINPHFLFNVLNSIRMKVLRKGDSESGEMISSLSKLLRMTIIQEQDAVPLHDEIDTIVDYVKLMNMRQKDNAELTLELAPDSLTLLVPRFFLQPIIENALIHGLNQQSGRLVITSEMAQGSDVTLTVKDNGNGMNEEELARLRSKLVHGVSQQDRAAGSNIRLSGIGLSNVFERMAMTYGSRFRMQIDSSSKGTVITMYIPALEVPDHV